MLIIYSRYPFFLLNSYITIDFLYQCFYIPLLGCVVTSLTRYYMYRKRKSRRGGSHSTLSILRREFPDGNFQSLFGGSSCIVSSSSSSNVAADPLLSSFISPIAEGFFTTESCISAETGSVKKTLTQSIPEGYISSSSHHLLCLNSYGHSC